MTKYIKNKKIIICITVIFTIILIPLILNFLISKFYWGIANDETWLLFWATWLGAITGGIVTMIGLRVTLVEGRKREEENRRLEVRPYLNIKHATEEECKLARFSKSFSYDFSSGESGYDTLNLYLVMENIGLGLALKVNVGLFGTENNRIGPLENLENIVIQKEAYVIIQSRIRIKNNEDVKLNNWILTIEFCDMLGNHYKQEFKIFSEHPINSDNAMSMFIPKTGKKILVTSVSDPILLKSI